MEILKGTIALMCKTKILVTLSQKNYGTKVQYRCAKNRERQELLHGHLLQTMDAEEWAQNETIENVKDKNSTFKLQGIDTEKSEIAGKMLQPETK